MSKRERPIGSKDYAAFVGPPEQYDFMGATQFRLLCALGLRAGHSVLDFGCGSLRAGRLLIPYLDANGYYGIDPNRWLIEEGLERHVGEDLKAIKSPRFDNNEAFDAGVFGRHFDFIVAQSIFSHTGLEHTRKALKSFSDHLESRGRILCTFVVGRGNPPETGWHYPDCINYPADVIDELADELALCAQALPWYHPRQTWYLLASDPTLLVPWDQLDLLNGAVMFDPDFVRSRDARIDRRSRRWRAIKDWLPRRKRR